MGQRGRIGCSTLVVVRIREDWKNRPCDEHERVRKWGCLHMTGMVQQVRRPTGGKHGGVVAISTQPVVISRAHARARSHTHRLSQQYSVMALMRSESGLWVVFFF